MESEALPLRGVKFSTSPSFGPDSQSADSMSRPTLAANDSGSSSDDPHNHAGAQIPIEYDELDSEVASGPDGDDIAPIHNTPFNSRSASSNRPRNGSGSSYPAQMENTGRLSPEAPMPTPARTHRPAPPVRAPSSTYAPIRHPVNVLSSTQSRHRSSSATRSRRDPRALYRSQEQAYVQRIRQDPNSDYFNSTSNLLFYQTESEIEDESPSSDAHFDNDLYNEDNILLYGHDEIEPSPEELKIPENRERLEWHSMLASVLMGDVVKQEKKRLIGGAEEKEDATMKIELFFGIRAKVCGRSVAAQRRVIEDGRSKVDALFEDIIHFEIQGRDRTDKSPQEQVQDIIMRYEKCEFLWPTKAAMKEAKPLCGSAAFIASWDAIVAWNNITELINTELRVLQNWVGNEELEFGRSLASVDRESGSIEHESSFLDRILKEDNLKSLNGDSNMLVGLSAVIGKAKKTLIEYAEAFEKRHLPPYVEELLALIGFPTRLIEEVIGMRLKYAERMREPVSMMTDQLILQFQSVLQLAVKIKQEYTGISQPEPGWDLPPCMDENFEQVVLQGLRYYFKLISWKIASNKNTFKEAEILETEWHFSNDIGRFIEGGDVEVAEQFSSLTSKLLTRLMSHFEKELQKPPEKRGDEISRRYKLILDSVRVRQRKLFRFARLLSQRFENASEYNVEKDKLRKLVDALIESGHFLVYTASVEHEGVYLVADPSLFDRPHQIQSILRTCFHEDVVRDDPSCPYVLIMCPQDDLLWDGRILNVDMKEPIVDIKPGRLRLVADGSQARLANARLAFGHSTNHNLDIKIEQRANLPRVNQELMKIKKTTYRLSNTIMDSVDKIRKQTSGLGCQELIQTCFAFATEFGQRSVLYMDNNRKAMNNVKLTRLAIDWVSFICDDCVASDRVTFRWAVIALEFAMVMTRGQNILSFNEAQYAKLRSKVAGCMSLLISHFDIMGARSTLAAQAEKQRIEALASQLKKMDVSKMLEDNDASKRVREEWLKKLAEIDDSRKQLQTERQALGRVLDDDNQTDRSLTYLSKSSFSNVSLRWQQGQFVGGGTFGTVYAAMNLDSGYLMAVKEIRLQDPQMIPQIANAIREEMQVLELLDHPNIVQYFGIEVHRDKVYLFMEYCSGGSLAGLLEHGRIEDETVIMIYTLQMLEGLAYLHESGIIHRDIKPENILLDHNGIIKYVDFGAAKVIAKQGKTRGAASAARTNLNSMTGTPMYMSPEVITGSNQGRQGSIDIWSLGCVVLEMATGRRPWANLDNEWAIMWNIAAGHPPQMPTADQLSESGIDFLKKCFERDPLIRSSAAELLQHDWILTIRNQVIEPSTPASDSGR
ncbi:Suppressor of Sensor Kinase (SLN1) [Rhizina undulata]